ncbi:MAG: adhesin, partial [Nitrospirae bacterium]|nr:adhesin [Nitrospirota bacterium]
GAIINSTGNETGVIVNGIPATVYGSQFIVNNVSLTEGSNTITVIATGTAGNTASSSITVNAVTTGNYIQLTANPESGISPLEVTLKIDGSFSSDTSNMNVSNSSGVEWLSTSVDEYKVRLTAEGIYYFTASVTGEDSNTYQDTVAVVVLNKNQLDNLLKAKWNAMKTALVNKDVNGALAYFAGSYKEMYQYNFELMKDVLSEIVQGMTDISMKGTEDEIAEYEMRTIVDGIERSYYIEFIRGLDGIWRINFF